MKDGAKGIAGAGNCKEELPGCEPWLDYGLDDFEHVLPHQSEARCPHS